MSASRELKRLALCLPRPAKRPPAGPGWIHEIKHDGFRILAERDATGVTLHTRRGYDFADRFPPRRGGCRRSRSWRWFRQSRVIVNFRAALCSR